MGTTRVPPGYMVFAAGVVIASIAMGAAGGFLPFGYGAIPGAISGLIVGLLWAQIMMRRVQSKSQRIIGPAVGWGAVMGLLAAVAVHGTMWVIVFASPAPAGPDDWMVWAVWRAAATIGIPIGILAGLVLGAICGAVLRYKMKPLAREREMTNVQGLGDPGHE